MAQYRLTLSGQLPFSCRGGRTGITITKPAGRYFILTVDTDREKEF